MNSLQRPGVCSRPHRRQGDTVTRAEGSCGHTLCSHPSKCRVSWNETLAQGHGGKTAPSGCAWGAGGATLKTEVESREGAAGLGGVPGSPRQPVPSSFSVPGTSRAGSRHRSPGTRLCSGGSPGPCLCSWESGKPPGLHPDGKCFPELRPPLLTHLEGSGWPALPAVFPSSASRTRQRGFSSSDLGRRAPKTGRGSQGRQLETAPSKISSPGASPGSWV